jgi:hypothetical protein
MIACTTRLIPTLDKGPDDSGNLTIGFSGVLSNGQDIDLTLLVPLKTKPNHRMLSELKDKPYDIQHFGHMVCATMESWFGLYKFTYPSNIDPDEPLSNISLEVTVEYNEYQRMVFIENKKEEEIKKKDERERKEGMKRKRTDADTGVFEKAVSFTQPLIFRQEVVFQGPVVFLKGAKILGNVVMNSEPPILEDHEDFGLL